jgi:hypothetical protein
MCDVMGNAQGHWHTDSKTGVRTLVAPDGSFIARESIILPRTAADEDTNVSEDYKALETKTICNTTVSVKQAQFQKFADLISSQFNHGGDKYKLPGFDDREATDVISAVFGGSSQYDWILGTMMKYIFRFKNFEREKDLLKIATYCYILWLKQGNFLKETHDDDTKR